jgi:hypothetical protein
MCNLIFDMGRRLVSTHFLGQTERKCILYYQRYFDTYTNLRDLIFQLSF